MSPLATGNRNPLSKRRDPPPEPQNSNVEASSPPPSKQIRRNEPNHHDRSSLGFAHLAQHRGHIIGNGQDSNVGDAELHAAATTTTTTAATAAAITTTSQEDDWMVEALYDRLITSVCTKVISKMHHAIQTHQMTSYCSDAPAAISYFASHRRELYPDLYNDSVNVDHDNPHHMANMLARYGIEVPFLSSTTIRNNVTATTTKLSNGAGPSPFFADNAMMDGKRNAVISPFMSESIVDISSTNRFPTTMNATSTAAVASSSIPSMANMVVSNNNNNNYNTTISSNNHNNNTSTAMHTRQHAFTQVDIYGRIPFKEPKEMIECSICHRPITTLRFASHLDKCMGIGTNTRAAAAAAMLIQQQQQQQHHQQQQQSSSSSPPSMQGTNGFTAGGGNNTTMQRLIREQ